MLMGLRKLLPHVPPRLELSRPCAHAEPPFAAPGAKPLTYDSIRAATWALIGAASCLLASSALAQSAQPQWLITDLGVLPGGNLSFAKKINNNGTIVGESNDPYSIAAGSRRTVVWVSKEIRALPMPAGSYPSLIVGAGGINDQDQVVSNIQFASGANVGARWDNVTSTTVATPFQYGPGSSQVLTINNKGDAVGWAGGPMQWAGNTRTPLGYRPGATSGFANASNSRSEAVGAMNGDGSSNLFATIWINQAAFKLSTLTGAVSSEARAINEHRITAGYGISSSRGRALRWDAQGSVYELPNFTDATFSEANGINDIGEIVGSAQRGTKRVPMLWRPNSPDPIDLFANSDASQKGWTYGNATGINDRGQIVGTGVINGQNHGFLLSCVDSDGDELCDDWERNGVNVYTANRGVVFLDLPQMGADPMHKDIFVHVDYMVNAIHSHKPLQDSILKMVQAFADAPVSNPDGKSGINLHIDCGPDCDTYKSGKKTGVWGTLSRARRVTEVASMNGPQGNNEVFHWGVLDSMKSQSFTNSGLTGAAQERHRVFRYALMGHNMTSIYNGKVISVGGLTRSIPASDFLIALGGLKNDTSPNGGTGYVDLEASTFMHELGHALGLNDGGVSRGGPNCQPNYLSVMNYSFGTRGGLLYGANGGILKQDYSRAALNTLRENGGLTEVGGLSGWSELANYYTYHSCSVVPSNLTCSTVQKAPAIANIDWNCDGQVGTASLVSFDVNGDGILTDLVGHNDWANISFKGGAIGGALVSNQTTSEITPITHRDMPEMRLPVDLAYYVDVKGTGPLALRRGETVALTFEILNLGRTGDAYDISINGPTGFFNTAGIPASVSLNAGAKTSIVVTVTMPQSVQPDERSGAVARLSLSAQSKSISAVRGGSDVDILLADGIRGDLNSDGFVDLADVELLQKSLGAQVFANDPRDLNRDGKVDALDLRILTTLCTRPRCAK